MFANPRNTNHIAMCCDVAPEYGDSPLETVVAAIAPQIALMGRCDPRDGICQKCGGDISAERLDLLPSTPFCKNCAT
jgi:hypothetical protein